MNYGVASLQFGNVYRLFETLLGKSHPPFASTPSVRCHEAKQKLCPICGQIMTPRSPALESANIPIYRDGDCRPDDAHDIWDRVRRKN